MTNPSRRWSPAGRALCALLAVLLTTAACGTADALAPTRHTVHDEVHAQQSAGSLPPASLGNGMVVFPSAADAWVQAHPDDPRTPLITKRIAGRPTALWLTGDESFGNLAEDAEQASARNRTMLLTLWNIPLRYDGLSSPTRVTLAAYESWVSRVAAGLHGNRAIIVLEPDALWFYDRLPSAADRRTRLTALNFAVTRLTRADPRARVYIDAGTASGSVTPNRMANLLVAAGVKRAAGYAVNVSSYAPTARIQSYAHGIRKALKQRGIANPRYVTDTGRNGATSWDNSWCNSSRQRLGTAPRIVRSWDGRDYDLWIKAPGTSDGDCGGVGTGLGSYGGQFLPALAYRMITG